MSLVLCWRAWGNRVTGLLPAYPSLSDIFHLWSNLIPAIAFIIYVQNPWQSTTRVDKIAIVIMMLAEHTDEANVYLFLFKEGMLQWQQPVLKFNAYVLDNLLYASSFKWLLAHNYKLFLLTFTAHKSVNCSFFDLLFGSKILLIFLSMKFCWQKWIHKTVERKWTLNYFSWGFRWVWRHESDGFLSSQFIIMLGLPFSVGAFFFYTFKMQTHHIVLQCIPGSEHCSMT